MDIPKCCGREMIAVMSLKTSANALSKEHDIPVYWCADCHTQVKRKVNV